MLLVKTKLCETCIHFGLNDKLVYNENTKNYEDDVPCYKYECEKNQFLYYQCRGYDCIR